MKRFVLGLLLGLILGSVTTVTAQLVGGYLHGWEVTKGGSVVCFDPYVYTSVKEIECE